MGLRREGPRRILGKTWRTGAAKGDAADERADQLWEVLREIRVFSALVQNLFYYVCRLIQSDERSQSR